MVRCPNCGRKTSGDYCQWCKYPILKGSTSRRRKAEEQAKKEAEKAEKQAKKEAEREAKEAARREAEEARKAKEAEKRARGEAEKAEKQAKKEAEREAKEAARREAEGVRKAKEAEKRARGEAEKAEKAVRDTGSRIYEGNFQLMVPLSASFEQVKQFKEYLEQVENLMIVWIGGSADGGTVITVLAQKPMTLIRILNEMPIVEKVDEKGEDIVVMLKPPTVS